MLSKCTPKNVLPKCTVKFVSYASSLLTSSHSGQARYCGTSLFVVQYSRSCEPDTATLPRVLCVERQLWAGFASDSICSDTVTCPFGQGRTLLFPICGAVSHSRYCHRVPHRVALYTFLSFCCSSSCSTELVLANKLHLLK